MIDLEEIFHKIAQHASTCPNCTEDAFCDEARKMLDEGGIPTLNLPPPEPKP